MLAQERYKKNIMTKLAISSCLIKANGKQALFDIHHSAEVFYMELLNMCGYNLIDANKIKLNQPGFDLIDGDRQILIQVSADASTTKINHSITIIENLEVDYTGYNLKFLFISELDTNAIKRRTFNTKKLRFEPKKDIIDINTLISFVNGLHLDKLKEISDFISKSLPISVNSGVDINQNLYKIVQAIADGSIDDEHERFNTIPTKFKIEDKIKFNDLINCYATIRDMSGYYSYINEIYNQLASAGDNTFDRVSRKVQREYRAILSNNASYDSSQVFHTLCESVANQVFVDERLTVSFDKDILEECVEIIVVDAFVKCKIFKNPEDSIYDTSN